MHARELLTLHYYMPFTNIFSLALYLVIGGSLPLIVRLLRRTTIQVSLPGPPGGNLFYGHLQRIIGPTGPDYQEHIFSTYGTTTQIRGVLYSKALFTIDPMIIGAVLIKDKNKFERPQEATIMVRSIFGGQGGLLGITSDEHRSQRKLLSPGFTVKHLRERKITVFMNISKRICLSISKELPKSTSPKELDLLKEAAAATLDTVGEIGFGYSFNSFGEDRNKYSDSVQEITQSLVRIGPFIQLLPYVHRLGTPAFRQWILEIAPFSAIQQLRLAVKAQNEQASNILRARRELISSGVDMSSEAGSGRDIITLLMKEATGSKLSIDRETLVGHMNIFIAAGHETASTAMARILDLLAHNLDIQNTLRDELNHYFDTDSELNPEGLFELPYLDGVVREALRLYPPFTVITRVCQEDTVLPLAYPINTPSGKIASIPIKKGTVVFLNNTFYNRHKDIWGERADEFLPERWVGKRLNEVTQTELRLPGVYSSMMTFGAGTHGCIGVKFAVMEIKAIVAGMIRKFKFGPATQECTWLNLGIQFPYLKADLENSNRLPKLFLKVEEL
ncbi:cytochrome P450 [Rhizoctonia solani]|nr:cytochrome P450 [Rhizoctonia solani]